MFLWDFFFSITWTKFLFFLFIPGKIKPSLVANYNYLQRLKSAVDLFTFLRFSPMVLIPTVVHINVSGLQQRHHVFSIGMAFSCDGHQFMWLREDDHRVCRAWIGGQYGFRDWKRKLGLNYQRRSKRNTKRNCWPACLHSRSDRLPNHWLKMSGAPLRAKMDNFHQGQLTN